MNYKKQSPQEPNNILDEINNITKGKDCLSSADLRKTTFNSTPPSGKRFYKLKAK